MSIEIIHTCERCRKQTAFSSVDDVIGIKTREDPLGQRPKPLCNTCEQEKQQVLEEIARFGKACVGAWLRNELQPVANLWNGE